MKNRNYLSVAVAFASLLLIDRAAGAAEAQAEAKHDTSAPLGQNAEEMQKAKALGPTEEAFVVRKEHRVRPVPLPKKTHKNVPELELEAPAAKPASLDVQKGVSFEGIGTGLTPPYQVTHAPPDTNGSVGENDYVQWVNEAFAVFDKATGKPRQGPTDGSALWKGFGGSCEHSNDGDPITLYDKTAKRWLMTQFAVSQGSPYSQCIAVSKGSDPLGAYYRYEFKFADFNDYPKFGVWPDAYYATFNMFQGNNFAGAKACAFDRAKMLAGSAATMQCFDAVDYAGLLPADIDGGAQPPAGSPGYFINFGDNELNLWRLTIDWSDSSKSRFEGPIAVAVAPFTPACDACVAQPKTTQKLQTLSDRMMYRLAYRNFGDHEALIANHTVQTKKNATGVRWYELRNPRATPVLQQQGTYAPDGAFRWLGSVATDKRGDLLVGYSVSSGSVYPAIRYAGRLAGDPANLLSKEIVVSLPGKGSQANADQPLDRWGDYSSISVDPSDDCTFWFTTEYLGATGTFNWRTYITSVRFKNCGS